MNIADFSDEAFNAYLAGFTDGEGYIGLETEKRTQKHFVRIILANCIRGVLHDIQVRLGYGSIRSQQQKAHWRERFVLVVQTLADCEEFLLRVRPYLQIKGEIADTALARINVSRSVLVKRHERNKAIAEAAQAGRMRKDIAHDFGLSPQAISRILEGHKWPSERARYTKTRKRNTLGHFVHEDASTSL